jgi:pyridoxamine 5'-phosphate oxidase
MNKSEVLAFLNANRTSHLATLEGDRPHVRAMGIHKADEDGIILQAYTTKDVHKQLVKNPNAELCFNNFKDGIQIRVSGTVEFVEDRALKDEVIAKRPFLKPLVEKEGYDIVTVYRLRKGLATVWTREADFTPKTYIKL